MKRMALAVAIAAALIGAQAAPAADNPSPVLDRIASQIAGHDVHVYCEGDPNAWDGGSAWGYTEPPDVDHIVHLHPWICSTLHDRIDGKPVALNAIAMAMHTLTHESIHQRGGVYADCNGVDESCEGRTDCEALQEDDATSAEFGYPKNIVTKTHRRVRRHHHWRVITIVKTQPNNDLNLIEWYQRQMHDSLPPQYHGDC